MNSKTKKLKVIGWTRYSDKYRDCSENPDAKYAEIIVLNELRKRKFKFGGNYHQYGEYGCPVLSDGSIFLASMRHWGGMMATLYGGWYVDYAWANVKDVEGGKAPTKRDHADAARYTEAELEEREKRQEEAAKRCEAEMKKREREKQKKHREDRKVLKEYLEKVVAKYGNDSESLIKFLSRDFFGVCERYHMKPSSAGMKWVLYKSERERVRKEAAKHLDEMFGGGGVVL